MRERAPSAQRNDSNRGPPNSSRSFRPDEPQNVVNSVTSADPAEGRPHICLL